MQEAHRCSMTPAEIAPFAVLIVAPPLIFCLWLVRSAGTQKRVRAILEQEARDGQ